MQAGAVPGVGADAGVSFVLSSSAFLNRFPHARQPYLARVLPRRELRSETPPACASA